MRSHHCCVLESIEDTLAFTARVCSATAVSRQHDERPFPVGSNVDACLSSQHEPRFGWQICPFSPVIRILMHLPCSVQVRNQHDFF